MKHVNMLLENFLQLALSSFPFGCSIRIAYALARSVCVRMLVLDSKGKAIPGRALTVPGS